MKALTLRPHWAWSAVNGYKDTENRSLAVAAARLGHGESGGNWWQASAGEPWQALISVWTPYFHALPFLIPMSRLPTFRNDPELDRTVLSNTSRTCFRKVALGLCDSRGLLGRSALIICDGHAGKFDNGTTGRQ